MNTPHPHFGSHEAKDHVKIIKDKHAVCRGEPHNTHHGFIYCMLKESCQCLILFGLLQVILFSLETPKGKIFALTLAFGGAYIFAKACLKAKSTWSYIELCHRSIKEEKNEVENNFDHEKEELVCIFSNKGFKEPLLSEMTEYVSSDSKLILDTMIREELNIDLENVPHPLIQSLSAIAGGGLGLCIFLPFLWFHKPSYIFLATTLTVITIAFLKARIIGNRAIHESVWLSAIFITSLGITYSLLQIFSS